MATIPPPTRPAGSLDESRRKVRGPLERLRGYIRAYVGLEGAAVVALYLALWFWIGLLLDFGVFKAFAFDWVQSADWRFRAAVLGVLTAGLLAAVALKVVTRLFREFRDPALALVLERRFPALLGDRLITAVELSDPAKAAGQGYSGAMVRQTIDEAAERVGQLPLKQVFDWRRLTRRGVWVVLLTAVAYALAGGLFVGVDRLTGGRAALGGFTGLHDAASIWFERNVLLQNTIWPRQAHLEFVGLAPGEGFKFGRDGTPPTVRVRAVKYVVAGAPTAAAAAAYRSWLQAHGATSEEADARAAEFRKKPAEGWRALTWFDLSPGLLGAPPAAPADALPADWDARDRDRGVTLDEVELRLDKPETHKTLAPDAHNALRAVLEQVDARAADPAQRRTLRRLKIPEQVFLLTKGNTTSGRATMERGQDHEYSGQFGDLKESGELPWSFTFTVQGEDYYTAPRPLAVLAPPTLEKLESEEFRPAYVYHPAAGGNLRPLRGRKQTLDPRDVYQSGSDTSKLEVPAGTDLVLHARATKDLAGVRLVPRQKGGAAVAGSVETEDARSFRVRFADLRTGQNFAIEMRDPDGVLGTRNVAITVRPDLPPDVNVVVDDVIRKVKEGYMVTAAARIPFGGNVADDNGVTELRFAYTVGRADGSSGLSAAALFGAGAPGLAAGGAGRWLAAAYFALAVREARPAAEGKVQYLPVARFRQDFAEEGRRFPFLEELLAVPPKTPAPNLFRTFEMKPDEWARPDEEPGRDFPLWKVNLGPSESQGRYRMLLWVEAVDNYADGPADPDGTPRPNVGQGKEKFPFVIVSEAELLNEIGKEEESLHADLEKVRDKLLEAEAKMAQVTLDLTGSGVKGQDLGPMSLRTEEADLVFSDGQVKSQDVAAKYDRILKELRVNRVEGTTVQRVEKEIRNPLQDLAEIEFKDLQDKTAAFRKALDDAPRPLPDRLAASREGGKAVREQLRNVITKLENVLSSMKGLITDAALVESLRKIKDEQEGQARDLRRLRDELEKIILDSALGGDDAKEKDKK